MNTNPFETMQKNVAMTAAEKAAMKSAVVSVMAASTSPAQTKTQPVKSVVFWRTMDFKLGIGAVAAAAFAVVIVVTQNFDKPIVGGVIGGAAQGQYAVPAEQMADMAAAPAATPMNAKLSSTPLHENTYTAQGNVTAKVGGGFSDQTPNTLYSVASAPVSQEQTNNLVQVSLIKEKIIILRSWNTNTVCVDQKKDAICKSARSQLTTIENYANAAVRDGDAKAIAAQTALTALESNREFVTIAQLDKLYESLF